MSKDICLGNDIFFSEEKNQLIKGSVTLSISEKEKQLLSYFTRHPDTELTKRDLIDVIWQQRAETTDDASLTQLIYKTRRNLAAVNLTHCIKTIPGKGYLFISDQKSADNSPLVESNLSGHARLIFSALVFSAFIILVFTLVYYLQPV